MLPTLLPKLKLPDNMCGEETFFEHVHFKFLRQLPFGPRLGGTDLANPDAGNHHYSCRW